MGFTDDLDDDDGLVDHIEDKLEDDDDFEEDDNPLEIGGEEP